MFEELIAGVRLAVGSCRCSHSASQGLPRMPLVVRWSSLFVAVARLAIVLILCLCSVPLAATAAVAEPIPPDASLLQLGQNRKLVALGKSIFEDENLSLKRNMSCATCHAIAAGGTAGSDLGNRLAGVHQGSAFQGFEFKPSAETALGLAMCRPVPTQH